ncbi:MAG: DUF3169 family protein [Angelakisella sp.]
MKNTDHTGKPKGKYATIIKFICLILAGAVFGGLLSFGLNFLQESTPAMVDSITAFLADVIVPVQWVVFLLLTVISVLLYIAGWRLVKAAEKDREDEAINDRCELLLGWGMALSSVNMILSYGLFGLATSLSLGIGGLLSGVGVIVLVMVYYSVYTANAVALIKRLYPEKKGDPLELACQTQWMASCDEAEQLVIYKSAYTSFGLLNFVLPILWVITVILSMFFGIGGFSAIIITIIWLVHTVGYQLAAIKLGRNKIN